MARILVDISNDETIELIPILQSIGHEVFCIESNDKTSKNAKNDLFLKNIEFDNPGITLGEITSKNFKSDIPIIPVINLTESPDYPTLKDVLKSAPYGYILKHYDKPHNINELKFTINMALYKRKTENEEDNENLEDDFTNKKTKKALRESEEKFRTFIQQSLDGIILLDEQGHIIEWNKGNELITGIKRDDVIGKAYWQVKYDLAPSERHTLNA
ncbi:PAS domain S-box protein [Methanobacterium petrolearium]|uniref:PAS domain S-box protein n=1 Tax=Methanobacterium petrolearium TaxID=710190 RepID=UPI003081C78D|nr:hypothetical protein GCM10025861_26980 [Methanobacterium petrolearium]